MAYGTNAPFGLKPLMSINGGSWTEKVNEYSIYASADGATTYATSIFTGDPVVWGTSMGATPAVNGAVGSIARYNPTFADATPSTFSVTPIVGVFMGCEYLSAVNGPLKYQTSAFWPASTQVVPGSTIKAFILDDPDVIFDIQVSTSIAAAANAFVGRPYFPNTNATGAASPFALAGDFGRNFALNIGGGGNFNTVYGPNPPFAANTAAGYANNPASGNIISGESAFYLDVDTSTVAANNHDYNKNVATLPLKALGYTQDVRNIAAPGLTKATTPFLNVKVMINNHAWSKGATPPVYVA